MKRPPGCCRGARKNNYHRPGIITVSREQDHSCRPAHPVQRHSRQTVSRKPVAIPCCWTASIEYWSRSGEAAADVAPQVRADQALVSTHQRDIDVRLVCRVGR